MNVRFEKRLWKLEMKPWVFKRLQERHPNLMVNIEELSLCRGAERRRLPIKELHVQ